MTSQSREYCSLNSFINENVVMVDLLECNLFNNVLMISLDRLSEETGYLNDSILQKSNFDQYLFEISFETYIHIDVRVKSMV